MNSRIVPISEIDVIFYEELSLNQVTMTYRIIQILSEYVFLTTDMLMTIYMQRYSQKIGLGALKKAVKERLIIEYQDDLNETTEKPIFYYALKGSTMLYLQKNHHAFLKMPFCAGQEEKSRLLTFNSFSIKHSIRLHMQYELDRFLRFFVTRDNQIYFFESAISAHAIVSKFEQLKIELLTPPIPIHQALTVIGAATKAIHPKNILMS